MLTRKNAETNHKPTPTHTQSNFFADY